MQKSWAWAPISSGFMAVSIIGFIVSVYLLNFGNEFLFKWGVALLIFFVMMFIASVISVSKIEPIPSHMEELAMHEQFSKRVEHSKFHAVHRLLEDHKNPPPKGIIWQDYLVGVYFLFLLYYLIMGIIQPDRFFDATIAHIFLMTTFAMVIYSIIDIFSSQKLGLFMKTVWTVAVIVFGGIGVIVFYIFRRVRNEVGR